MTNTSSRDAAPETDGAIPALTSYHHMALTVSDVGRSEAWYGQVLGFQRAFVERHPNGTDYAVVMTRPGTALFLGLDHHDANDSEEFAEHRTGLDHLAIGVEHRGDLNRWAEHFDRLGVRRSGIEEGTAGGMSYAALNFRDPDNIALELTWMS